MRGKIFDRGNQKNKSDSKFFHSISEIVVIDYHLPKQVSVEGFEVPAGDLLSVNLLAQGKGSKTTPPQRFSSATLARGMTSKRNFS